MTELQRYCPKSIQRTCTVSTQAEHWTQHISSAAAAASVLLQYVHRMCSGSVLRVGQLAFSSAQTPIHNHWSCALHFIIDCAPPVKIVACRLLWLLRESLKKLNPDDIKGLMKDTVELHYRKCWIQRFWSLTRRNSEDLSLLIILSSCLCLLWVLVLSDACKTDDWKMKGLLCRQALKGKDIYCARMI